MERRGGREVVDGGTAVKQSAFSLLSLPPLLSTLLHPLFLFLISLSQSPKIAPSLFPPPPQPVRLSRVSLSLSLLKQK